MTEFKKMLFKNKGRIISTALLNIATSFAMVYAGYSLSYIFTSYESNGNRAGELALSCVAVFSIWLLAILIFYFAGIFQAGTLKKLKNDLRSLIAKKFL